jgi:hypothetical protein
MEIPGGDGIPPGRLHLAPTTVYSITASTVYQVLSSGNLTPQRLAEADGSLT